MPEELWMEVCYVIPEAGIKAIPKKKTCEKAKWLSEEALQIAVNRREQSFGLCGRGRGWDDLGE